MCTYLLFQCNKNCIILELKDYMKHKLLHPWCSELTWFFKTINFSNKWNKCENIMKMSFNTISYPNTICFLAINYPKWIVGSWLRAENHIKNILHIKFMADENKTNGIFLRFYSSSFSFVLQNETQIYLLQFLFLLLHYWSRCFCYYRFLDGACVFEGLFLMWSVCATGIYDSLKWKTMKEKIQPWLSGYSCPVCNKALVQCVISLIVIYEMSIV